MLKWYEETDKESPNIVYSRIRLVRNWDEYPFSGKLSREQAGEMVNRLERGMRDFCLEDGRDFDYMPLENLSDLDRRALRERRILNETLAGKKEPAGLILSRDERVSVVLNGDDHIRMQFIAPGMHLKELWREADRADDFINERFDYAYDDKYGFLTAFPTNVGTGLRASAVVHLPSLSSGRKFASLLGEMSRFGASIRGLYGEGDENYGSLYVVSNQKTLGVTEEEIVEIVEKVARQLSSQEQQVRDRARAADSLGLRDEAYKSYGVLRYARRLSWKDAMVFLSRLMAGASDGLLEFAEPCPIFSVMLGIQKANLQKITERPLSREELDVARASYIRAELPELKLA